MAETDIHREQMVDLIHGLSHFFADRSDVYVSGNILMLYDPLDGRKYRAPDVLVALGVERRLRENYKIWEEGKAPDLIFEITSSSTRTEDLGEKKGLYALLGVREYVVFDPLEEYLDPPLRLYRRTGEDFVPVTGQPLLLETVGLELAVVGGRLRLRHPRTGELLPTAEERVERERQRAERERQRAERERQRAERAEREVARLRAELERLRGDG